VYCDYSHDSYAQDEADFLKRIAKAIRFNQKDIAENQAGKISTPQMVRLTLGGLLPFIGLVVTMVGICASLVALVLFGPLIMGKVRLMLALSKYLLLGISAVAFGTLAFIVKFFLASGRAIQLLRDLAFGKVTSVIGRLTTSRAEEIEDGFNQLTRQKSSTYSFVVKGEYFEVNEDAWSLMNNHDGGGTYRLYITPHSRYLLALEKAVSEAAADPFKARQSAYTD
jgi:hypothetical protein